MSNRQNEKFVGAWLGPEEYRHLIQQKEICGLSISSMIRSWINSESLQPKPPEVYADLLRQLAGIGNNLNRQAEGIAAAKARGVKFGRPPLPLPENFHEVHKAWRGKKLTLCQAAKACNLLEGTFYAKARKFEKAS